MKLRIDGEKKNIVGENVRRARVKLHLSQQDVSERLEAIRIYICRGAMSRIEKGNRIVTDIELEGFAKVMNVPVAKFFEPLD